MDKRKEHESVFFSKVSPRPVGGVVYTARRGFIPVELDDCIESWDKEYKLEVIADGPTPKVAVGYPVISGLGRHVKELSEEAEEHLHEGIREVLTMAEKGTAMTVYLSLCVGGLEAEVHLPSEMHQAFFAEQMLASVRYLVERYYQGNNPDFLFAGRADFDINARFVDSDGNQHRVVEIQKDPLGILDFVSSTYLFGNTGSATLHEYVDDFLVNKKFDPTNTDQPAFRVSVLRGDIDRCVGYKTKEGSRLLDSLAVEEYDGLLVPGSGVPEIESRYLVALRSSDPDHELSLPFMARGELYAITGSVEDFVKVLSLKTGQVFVAPSRVFFSDQFIQIDALSIMFSEQEDSVIANWGKMHVISDGSSHVEDILARVILGMQGQVAQLAHISVISTGGAEKRKKVAQGMVANIQKTLLRVAVLVGMDVNELASLCISKGEINMEKEEE